MKGAGELRRLLYALDRRGYKAYREIQGSYQFGDFLLSIDKVQSDPFADPSQMRVRVKRSLAGFPADSHATKSREVGLRDYLTRQFHRAIRRICRGRRGTGTSGLVKIDCPAQEILPRTSCLLDERHLEVRFRMGLPAAGRSILAPEAVAMFFDELPQVVRASLFFKNLDRRGLYRHIEVNEDQDFLRGKLKASRLVAFVADGARLPRLSGVDDRPQAEAVVPFRSPPSLRHTFIRPNGGEISGMGIPEGVTLIVGGGYHGKSTLLDALQRSVYNHIPGDGREFCVTVPEAVKIRAEDGRNIECVDIRPFINRLPHGRDTTSFSSGNASGSTSQAANIIEMLEVGATALLIDEDTSATNFMIRDHRMQLLVAKEKEPITPLIDKVRQLYSEKGVSTVLIAGGCGDYFDVATTVIAMDEYLPREVTDEARRIAAEVATGRQSEAGGSFGTIRDRVPIPESIDPSRDARQVKLKVRGLQEIGFGAHRIDLSAVEQLVSASQVRAVAEALVYARQNYIDGRRCLREVVGLVERDFLEKGLEVLGRGPGGEYALPRRLEVAAALNRLRSLKIKRGR